MVVGDLPQKTDVVVIGAGPGGYVAAIRMAQLGKSVTLIDKEEVGGLCLHHGCIPSKAIIYAADAFHDVHHLNIYGITIGKSTIDINQLQTYKKETIAKLAQGVKSLLKSYNIEVIYGNALFTSSSAVRVETDKGFAIIEFDNAIIATGTKAIELPLMKYNGRTILSSREMLDVAEIPKNLVIVGGGYIGVEIGTAFAKIGSNVTIVEILDNILVNLDPDAAFLVTKRMQELGMTILTSSKITEIKEQKSRLALTIEQKDKKQILQADKLLVSVGFKPYTEGLGLENTRVKLDEKGCIKVNERYQTNDPLIYAIGDIIGPPFLAHKSSKEGRMVAGIIAGKDEEPMYKAIPSVVFSDPEVSWVGLTEKEAKEKSIAYEAKKFPFAAISKSVISNATNGFVKFIYDKNTHEILGVTIIGKDSGNLIGEATLAIEMGAVVEDIALTIHPHPTLIESLMEAAEYAKGSPVHIFDRRILDKKL